jgi:hypothetical protein
LEEDEDEETSDYIYDTISEPYAAPDGLYLVDVLIFTEEGQMTTGTVRLPNLITAQSLMKYFRTNVDPLSGEDLNEFIETHRRRVMQ